MKALRRLVLLPVAFAAGGGHAAAQCVMCGIAAEAANPEAASRTLATAILVLLLPALGVLAGVAVLLWRYRGDRTA